MRIAVDLPADVHQRALSLAEANGASVSATITELVSRGIADLDRRRRVAE